MTTKNLTSNQSQELLKILKNRFEKNTNRHPNLDWSFIEKKLLSSPQRLWSLNEMERTGGEPDVIVFPNQPDNYFFVDCSAESPSERRSLCYDRLAWENRKVAKPKNNALDVASDMGIEILTKDQYQYLQTIGSFDTKTSSWLITPTAIRKHGGAIFGDRRYDHVFIYHNGADSYYAARGFRGVLQV